MNTKRHPKQICIDLLRRSNCRVQMAAVIVDRKGKVSWGWNHGQTPKDRSVHAEEHALRRANPWRLKGSTLYLAGRRVGSGNYVKAYPCKKKCLLLVQIVQIKTLVWLDKDGTWKKETL